MKFKNQLFSILLLLPLHIWAQSEIPNDELSIQNGQELFDQHCQRCHLFGEQKIGPSLSSITDKRPVSWLLNFIESSQTVINSGEDPYALHLFRSYNNMVMPDYRQLDESEFLDILAYIRNESQGEYYNYVEDSVNYYDENLISSARERVDGTQESEVNYYEENYNQKLPNDLPTIENGAVLFDEHCSVCHQLAIRTAGPALASVTDRRPLSWLMDFISSPSQVLEQGDDYANYLLTHYPFVMPNFDYLSDQDKLSVLAYIRNESGALTHVAGTNANAVTEAESDESQTAPAPKTGDQDEMGIGEDPKETYKIFSRPMAMLLGAVMLILAIVIWRVYRS